MVRLYRIERRRVLTLLQSYAHLNPQPPSSSDTSSSLSLVTGRGMLWTRHHNSEKNSRLDPFRTLPYCESSHCVNAKSGEIALIALVGNQIKKRWSYLRTCIRFLRLLVCNNRLLDLYIWTMEHLMLEHVFCNIASLETNKWHTSSGQHWHNFKWFAMLRVKVVWYNDSWEFGNQRLWPSVPAQCLHPRPGNASPSDR